MIDLNTPHIVTKFSFQFYQLMLNNLFLKYLYFDYGKSRNPNMLGSCKSDIVKVFGLLDNLL